ncbi:MAG: phosphoglycolate phosphatase [Paracoccaceae bacterium]
MGGVSRPAVIVFDLDGTLVDSAPDIHRAAVAMLEGLGRAPVSLEQTVSFVGNGVGKLVERCLGATGGVPADGTGPALAAFRLAYDRAPAALTRPYPGVETALGTLAAAGHPLAVCTNKPEAPAREILAALGLAPRFRAVIGGDTTGVLKPDPAPLLAAIRAAGQGPALFVGDSETDAATAEAAAVPFALFTRGYRKSPVAAIRADAAFDDFARLPGLLAEIRAA